jgi:hypothetical protein
MDKLTELQSKQNAKRQQYNDTPNSSWKKELFKLELDLIAGKIALQEFKEKNK